MHKSLGSKDKGITKVSFTLILPAAGMGTRMGVDFPKAFVLFDGQHLVEFATATIAPESTQIVAVIAPKFEDYFKQNLVQLHGKEVVFTIQENPTGTAEAVRVGLAAATCDVSIIVWADHIGGHFFDSHVLESILKLSHWDVLVPIVKRRAPYVYFDVNSDGEISAFHETRKGAARKDSGFSDCGIFVAKTSKLREFLARFSFTEDEEVNFLSLLPVMCSEGMSVKTLELNDYRLTLGANSQEELLRVLEELR